jgi:MFS family permease
MTFLALPWLVLTTTGSAALTGLVAFAEMAPYVTVEAVGGPAIDRVGARRASIGSDIVAAVFMGAIPVLSALHELPIPVLAGLVAVAGAARGAGDAARNVLVPGVNELAGGRIERSSGLYDGVVRVATLIGLPASGVLVTVLPAADVLAIDAGTFVVSAMAITVFVPPGAQPSRPNELPGETSSTYFESLREGFAYLYRDRLLVAIAAMILVTNFVDQAGGTVLTPVWAHDIAHSAIALGLLGAAFALGAVAGNGLTTWLAPRWPRRMTYAAGFLVAGAPRYLALALSSTVSPVLAVMFLSGLGAGGINPMVGAVSYQRVPRHLQARVLGAFGASAWAGIPLGSLAGGFLVSLVGDRPALLAAGAVYLIATLPPFVFPVWRQMDAAPERRPIAAPPPTEVRSGGIPRDCRHPHPRSDSAEALGGRSASHQGDEPDGSPAPSRASAEAAPGQTDTKSSGAAPPIAAPGRDRKSAQPEASEG